MSNYYNLITLLLSVVLTSNNRCNHLNYSVNNTTFTNTLSTPLELYLIKLVNIRFLSKFVRNYINIFKSMHVYDERSSYSRPKRSTCLECFGARPSASQESVANPASQESAVNPTEATSPTEATPTEATNPTEATPTEATAENPCTTLAIIPRRRRRENTQNEENEENEEGNNSRRSRCCGLDSYDEQSLINCAASNAPFEDIKVSIIVNYVQLFIITIGGCIAMQLITSKNKLFIIIAICLLILIMLLLDQQLQRESQL